ncbi:AAA family ATPase [Methylomarinum vadi]|uniref:AAA family ATPase n=1 Tax=Methylomarinum vadi TaxID=438855 RepID=UPI0004DF19AF
MYKTFYKLTKNPFQLNADPAFFFDSSGHKRAKAYLRYGLAQGEGFVVVTGVPGTGKTMLVKELSKFLEKDQSVVIGSLVSSSVGAEDTLRLLAATFAINYELDDTKATLLNRIEGFFKEKAKQGKRVLLIVDEAHNLPNQSIEELRMLSNFEWEGNIIFQTFLIGQEELGKRIFSPDMEQVRQRIVATYQLKALNVEETRDYIFFRLEKAGWQGNPRFHDEAITAIFDFSKGIPRRINTVCDRLLLYGFLEELNHIDLNATQKVIAEIKEDYKTMAAQKINNNISPQTTTITPIDGNLEQKVAMLEQTVNELSLKLKKEQELLRKAILIQLDMSDVYSDGE